MGGPGASVVLGKELTIDDHNKIEDLIDCIGNRPLTTRDWPDFWIVTTKPIGGGYEGVGRPFGIKWTIGELFDNHYADFPSFRDIVSRYFALRPCSSIDLIAYAGSPEDHRILGALALYLARTFEGLIDFDGALMPNDFNRAIKPFINRSVDREINSYLDIFRHADWSDVSDSTLQLLNSMPGRIIDIPYQIANGRTWVTHICDAEFMAAWLNHPDFHMIK